MCPRSHPGVDRGCRRRRKNSGAIGQGIPTPSSSFEWRSGDSANRRQTAGGVTAESSRRDCPRQRRAGAKRRIRPQTACGTGPRPSMRAPIPRRSMTCESSPRPIGTNWTFAFSGTQCRLAMSLIDIPSHSRRQPTRKMSPTVGGCCRWLSRRSPWGRSFSPE